jgi:hypothetical protein
VPRQVKLACGFQAAWSAMLAAESGNVPAGIRSFSIGSLGVGFTNARDDIKQGLCQRARDLLQGHRKIFVG